MLLATTSYAGRVLAHTQRRSAALALTLVIALLGAPASSALRRECDLCPRTCPMHRHGGDAHTRQPPQLGCHRAPGAAAERLAGTGTRVRPIVGRATCGTHGAVSATVLPPMLLPAPRPRLAVAAVWSSSPSSVARRGRGTDPPNTPPPIALI